MEKGEKQVQVRGNVRLANRAIASGTTRSRHPAGKPVSSAANITSQICGARSIAPRVPPISNSSSRVSSTKSDQIRVKNKNSDRVPSVFIAMQQFVPIRIHSCLFVSIRVRLLKTKNYQQTHFHIFNSVTTQRLTPIPVRLARKKEPVSLRCRTCICLITFQRFDQDRPRPRPRPRFPRFREGQRELNFPISLHLQVLALIFIHLCEPELSTQTGRPSR